MALAVLLAKCMLVTILCVLRRRLVQCVACCLLLIAFADNLSIVFNAKNQSLILSLLVRLIVLLIQACFFYIGGNAIEIVNQWPQLGHIIDNRPDDDADISLFHSRPN